MSQPVGVVAPGTYPSFHCAVDSNIVDGSAVDKINNRVQREIRQGKMGAGADAYLAAERLTALKGIATNKDGTALGNKLMSRAFGLRTVGDLVAISDADFQKKMNNPIEPLKASEIELVSTLRAALLTCKLPSTGAVGHKIKVTENDPTMDAKVTQGRETVQANKGRDGYAEVVLQSHPSNNGTVASFISLSFAGFTEPGRGGPVQHPGFKVSVLASGSTQATLERLKDALEDQGLASAIMPASRGGSSLRPTQAIQIWSPRAI